MRKMTNYQKLCDQIRNDERYKRNVMYGKPRPGHAEGTVAAHIADLETNLKTLSALGRVSDECYWKLMVLIHVHDSFKAEATRNAPILDPQSHSSLAREYLKQLCDDEDLINIVQYHDIGYAIFKNYKEHGWIDEMRLLSAMQYIRDKNLFLMFAIIDACTPSKGREGITWLVETVGKLYQGITVTVHDILPGEKQLAGQVW